MDEYIAATEILGKEDSLVTACRFFVAQEDKIIPIKVADLVNDYERYLIGQKVGKIHLDKTIKIYLKRFASAFSMNIDVIRLKDLEAWRATFTTEPRTINNYLNATKALFNYAQDHNHLPRTRRNEAARLKDIEETPTEANPFTIEEMALLHVKADNKSLPYLVLGGFAGIRQRSRNASTGRNTCAGTPAISTSPAK